MGLAYTRIARPEELLGVASPTAYLQKLTEVLRDRRTARPSPYITWPEPHAGGPAAISIRQGRWVLECPCGSLNSYNPDWQFSVCLACAAIYRQAPPPDWQEIEACLMRRPQENRNYWQDDTLAALRAENDAHGYGEGA